MMEVRKAVVVIAAKKSESVASGADQTPKAGVMGLSKTEVVLPPEGKAKRRFECLEQTLFGGVGSRSNGEEQDCSREACVAVKEC